MDLASFYDYKNKLMEDLLTNEEILRCLSDDCKIADDPKSLVYTQVFPYEFIPDTVEHGQTFICCDVDIQRSLNKNIHTPLLYIWIFTHKSKMRLPEGGVRVDKICSEIAKSINGSRFYGLGQLDLYSVKRFAPFTEFQGKVMIFEAADINRFRDPNRPVPSNRKEYNANP